MVLQPLASAVVVDKAVGLDNFPLIDGHIGHIQADFLGFTTIEIHGGKMELRQVDLAGMTSSAFTHKLRM